MSCYAEQKSRVQGVTQTYPIYLHISPAVLFYVIWLMASLEVELI